MDRDSFTAETRAATENLRQPSAVKNSRYDDLTGLPTMTCFFELADPNMKRIVDQGGSPALMYMDFSGIPHSINLSRSDFNACDIVEEIRRRVDAAGIDHGRISIEITESVIGSDFEFMKRQVERFRALGFPVWMDDFGSGYSSLDVLQSIRFDLIKFDMSFMRKLDEGDSGKVILTELMRMATSLGVDTVCEGVETQAQVRFLQEIGCSKLQGYYSKPIPFDTVLERRRNRTLIPHENPEESAYYESISRANLSDLGVVASEGENALQNAFSTIPIAILEVNGDQARYVRSNRSYQDFIRRFFHIDMLEKLVDFGGSSIGYGDTFVSVVRQCCGSTSRAFFNEAMPDGSLVHTFARRINVNPVTGSTAVAIAVLSITDPDESTTYADIARSLAADYYNIYVIDLDTDRYIEYTSRVGGEELSIERHGEDFFESARRDTMTRIYEEDREPFLKWFTRENVLRELDAQVRQEEDFRRRLEQAQTEASLDALTGVKNKHAYLAAEAHMDHRIAQHLQGPFAVVICDVNDLKTVNDTSGHRSGDQYLCDACRIICDIFKRSPVFRVGGDEFAVICQGNDYARIDRLMDRLNDNNREATGGDGIMIACGMARYDAENDTCLAAVYDRADSSMYENKRALKSSQA